jgi:hypothetical protein
MNEAFDKSLLEQYRQPKRHGKLSDIIPNGKYVLMQSDDDGAMIEVSKDPDEYDQLSMEVFPFEKLSEKDRAILTTYANINQRTLRKSDKFVLYKLWDKTTKSNVWFWRGVMWD